MLYPLLPLLSGWMGQRCGDFWLTLSLVLALSSVGFVWKERGELQLAYGRGMGKV